MFIAKRPVFIQCLLQRDLFLYNVYCKETCFHTKFIAKRPVFIQCLLQIDLFLYNVYCKETCFYTMFIAKRPVFIQYLLQRDLVLYNVYCKEIWFYTMFIAKRPVLTQYNPYSYSQFKHVDKELHKLCSNIATRVLNIQFNTYNIIFLIIKQLNIELVNHIKCQINSSKWSKR